LSQKISQKNTFFALTNYSRLVTRPIVGVLSFVQRVTAGIAATPQAITPEEIKINQKPHRVRPPRYFDGTGVVRVR
jgi:hypothetical protein